jgi:hypothetical protein
VSRRGLILVALILVCAATAAGVVVISASDAPATPDDTSARIAPPAPPYMVFRSLDRADPATYGRIAAIGLDDLDGPRRLGGLVCDRLDFQGERGICLALDDSFPQGYRAQLLGPDLAPTGSVAVAGIPSRARVSPDGRLGAVTTFVSGHSYAEIGGFSTQATIIDMVTGKPIVTSLEDWRVTRGGTRVESVDENFWGVTFAPDGDTFYATLATGGTTFLVRGSVEGKSMTVIRQNAECPSVSPDGRRVS